MGVLIPKIGVTGCFRTMAFLENHLDTIVGTFWVMNGYGSDGIPGWWIDIVLQDNQAEAILDAYEEGYFSKGHDGPLYLGFCITVTADRGNPTNLTYIVEHVRMEDFEAVGLLKVLAEHNIPAQTEVSYPMDFLLERYDYNEKSIPELLKSLDRWSTQIWEDYCNYLLAENGEKMIVEYWRKAH